MRGFQNQPQLNYYGIDESEDIDVLHNQIDGLEGILHAHLAPARVLGIDVAEEVDADGDQVLRVKVILDSKGPKVDDGKIFSATGVVRSFLARLPDNRFPLLSFPSSDETSGVAA